MKPNTAHMFVGAIIASLNFVAYSCESVLDNARAICGIVGILGIIIFVLLIIVDSN